MLWENSNYTADISFLTNNFIREYDISKANISVLYTKGVLDRNTYMDLYDSGRMIRQKYVGLLQRNDPKITEILKSGIIEAKRMLFESNGINDGDVLAIKNDAVFIINKQPSNTKFGIIEFKEKNIYTGYYNIARMEFYYFYNLVSKEEKLDIKGLSDNLYPLHENYMIQLLKNVFYLVQIAGPLPAIKMLRDVYNDYINLRLNMGFYRTFDSNSMYVFKPSYRFNTIYSINQITDDMKPLLDIRYNATVMTNIQQILTSIALSNR